MSTVHCFSDGCAVLYKNCRHFVHHCHHLTDFSTDCIWNIFITSHDKSLCDGIGSTVEMLKARASLQCPISSQILSAKTMFEFCQDSIQVINFIYTSSNEINIIQSTSLFSLAQTVLVYGAAINLFPHQHLPWKWKVKRVSDDKEFESKFHFLINQTCLDQIKISAYLLCKYDDQYWIGIVLDIDEATSDVKVKFMHPYTQEYLFLAISRWCLLGTTYTHKNNNSNATIITCISSTIYQF